MKKLATIFAMLVLVLTACTGQESKQRHGVPPMTTEEREVYFAYEAINNAMIKKDKAAMERYFDENLTFTHMSGKKQTREEFIGEIMDGTLNYFKVDTKDYSISVNGDTAHMKVTHTLTAKVYGISGSWTMGGENTYKKRDGIWVRVRYFSFISILPFIPQSSFSVRF